MAQKKKVLIIEDDKFLNELYAELIKDEGHQVTTASNGEQGYNQMKKGGFDLVLLDVMLPKMDGIDILKKLDSEKALDKNKKVILLTNLSGEAVFKKKGRLQVDDYLVKSSLTPDQFLEKVKTYLS